MSITKEQFRKYCIGKSKKVGVNKKYLDSIVNTRLSQILQKYKQASILFYIPLPFEADIRKTLQKMRKKHNIFVPFMEGKSFKMVPYRLPLKRKKFGIYEAGNSLRNIKKIDIAIVPVVGVDRDFKRVGFGKGMYDRFFEKLRKKPYTIFVQRKSCQSLESICDKHDISADILITSDVWLEKRR